mmetsp:Transcript_7554/g.31262  ORF Transcript_7554/g.31262 Transcript_7554/m.31262 type:complete len:240 (-) Transcript_7554:208-927(-)
MGSSSSSKEWCLGECRSKRAAMSKQRTAVLLRLAAPRDALPRREPVGLGRPRGRLVDGAAALFAPRAPSRRARTRPRLRVGCRRRPHHPAPRGPPRRPRRPRAPRRAGLRARGPLVRAVRQRRTELRAAGDDDVIEYHLTTRPRRHRGLLARRDGPLLDAGRRAGQRCGRRGGPVEGLRCVLDVRRCGHARRLGDSWVGRDGVRLRRRLHAGRRVAPVVRRRLLGRARAGPWWWWWDNG